LIILRYEIILISNINSLFIGIWIVELLCHLTGFIVWNVEFIRQETISDDIFANEVLELGCVLAEDQGVGVAVFLYLHHFRAILDA
jgi:hypothetical protein